MLFASRRRQYCDFKKNNHMKKKRNHIQKKRNHMVEKPAAHLTPGSEKVHGRPQRNSSRNNVHLRIRVDKPSSPPIR
ncbi:hypothetical protein PBY51_001351 [Eleginops maclovinus]|uniref:Uncharacterized protein n=1 Tax=Eleginops maclovinus TaxID=56733 RepID=A0AAN7WN98_ELEMC|nr:hypothetical protein PBY51_001351 [Eleginops maclovinus]